MKILLAAHGFPPTHSAGAERRAERMALWHTAQGHQVEVITVEETDVPDFKVTTKVENGFTIHRLHYDIWEHDRFSSYHDHPQVGQAIENLLSTTSFDLMHIVSGYYMGGQAIHPAKHHHIPVVITLTEFWFLCQRLTLIQPTGALCSGPESHEKCMRCYWESKQAYLIPALHVPALMDNVWPLLRYAPHAISKTKAFAQRQASLKEALNTVDLVICPSQFLISKFAEHDFDTSNYIFMRQGLNFPLELEKNPPNPPGDELKLLYIGQIQPHKGVDILIDAVTSLTDSGHNITLDLWGSEDQDVAYTQKLKAQSQPYDNIRWNGRYTGPKVWEILANTDTLVIPSRWYENSPNVILEAYVMGVPVIATNLGGMSELVEHEKSGLVFELNNPADLAHQIKRLLDEPDLKPRLQNGIPAVKTIDDEMQEIMAHYQQLLSQREQQGH